MLLILPPFSFLPIASLIIFVLKHWWFISQKHFWINNESNIWMAETTFILLLQCDSIFRHLSHVFTATFYRSYILHLINAHAA
jgi:hypothetical protein